MAIKYMAWLKNEKEMHKVTSIDYGRNKVYLFAAETVDMDDVELLLFSGSMDNQDYPEQKEIYAGDILKNDLNNMVFEVHFGEYQMFCPADRCYMKNFGFYVTSPNLDKDVYMPLGPTEKYARKIGTVFQNPELLEV